MERMHEEDGGPEIDRAGDRYRDIANLMRNYSPRDDREPPGSINHKSHGRPVFEGEAIESNRHSAAYVNKALEKPRPLRNLDR